MSLPTAARITRPSVRSTAPRAVVVIRAGLALLWAAGFAVAIAHRVPQSSSELPWAAALLLTTYPLIDVAASLVAAGKTRDGRRALHVNAAVGIAAVIALAVTAFGADSGATLAAFGAWAATSGALQLAQAVRARRAGGQIPMIVSGALSTLAGLSFIAAAGNADTNLTAIAGYMAIGAVLYLVSAARTQ